jgi:C1A family cysteine protease
MPKQNSVVTDPGSDTAILPRFAPGGGPDSVGGRKIVAMGWQPDLPDWRDFSLKQLQERFKAEGKKLPLSPGGARLKKKVDNRRFCSPIEDQGNLGSCTAQAVAGMMEYLNRRKKKKHLDLSRLFLYKATRNLLGWTGDTGAYIRSTIQAATVFGVPPEEHWPYDISRFEEEPSAFLYSFAANFQALNYVRLDTNGTKPDAVLEQIKVVLSSRYAVAFGFSVFSSISNAADIPFPTPADRLSGGHAVLAVGYDEDHKTAGGEKVPSLLIRNSWGRSWGDQGYGWLPCDYVLSGLARDFWCIFKAEWIDLESFS